MAEEQTVCRWAALSLSTIAAIFLKDLVTPRSAPRLRHELVAISTTGSLDRARTWLADNQIPNAENIKVYHSWEEMLRTEAVDVIYISTPHPLHYPMVKKALENRRNVLVEKPATMNRSQYEVLSSLAKSQNVVLMEAMWTRYQPLARYLKEELLPQIGDVRRVFSDFAFPIWSPEMPLSSRWLDKDAEAGCLLDQGVYALTWVDMALNGLGADQRTSTKVVYSSTMSIPGVPNDVDDLNMIVISKQDKRSKKQEAFAVVTTGMTMPGSTKGDILNRLNAKKYAPTVRIEGTKALVAIPFPPIRAEKLEVQWYDDSHLDEDGKEKDELIERPLEGWGIWYQAEEIGRLVHERKTQHVETGVVIGGEETLRVLGWIDDARRQAGIEYSPDLEAL